MSTHVDAAIAKLNDKIAVLILARQELEAVKDAAPVAVEKKTRKPRTKRGLPDPQAGMHNSSNTL